MAGTANLALQWAPFALSGGLAAGVLARRTSERREEKRAAERALRRPPAPFARDDATPISLPKPQQPGGRGFSAGVAVARPADHAPISLRRARKPPLTARDRHRAIRALAEAAGDSGGPVEDADRIRLLLAEVVRQASALPDARRVALLDAAQTLADAGLAGAAGWTARRARLLPEARAKFARVRAQDDEEQDEHRDALRHQRRARMMGRRWQQPPKEQGRGV